MPELFDTLSLSREGRVSAGTLEFTAVACKTTALYPGHIIELAAVRVKADGTVLRELSTLVNPDIGVDPGPTHVHQITRESLDGAPPFDEILGRFVEMCRDSVVVAHNLPFEQRFLTAELERFAIRMPTLPAVCTLASVKQALKLPNYRMATVAGAFGIADFPAHLALADARVSAQIASALVTAHGFGLSAQPRFHKLPRLRSSVRPVPRPDTRPIRNTGWMAGLADRMPSRSVGALEDAYLEMLSEALADRHISEHESHALAMLAANAGMSKDEVRRVHKGFVAALRAVAEADGIVTVDEESDVRRVAHALGVPEVVHDLHATNAPTRPANARVLVLGASAEADRLRAHVLASGTQLAKKLTASVTHLVADHTVPRNEPRLTRAHELDIPTLDLPAARVAFGFDPPAQAPSPSTAPATPARDKRFWASRVLMGLGLLFMFSSIVSLFNGSGFAAGLVAGLLGVGALIGGWYLSEDPETRALEPGQRIQAPR